MKKIFWIVGLGILSCTTEQSLNQAYPNDIQVSDQAGKAHDSLTRYFPASIRVDTGLVVTGIDTADFQSRSEILYLMDEPVLSNYYLGHNQYRFLWLRSFERPIVITLHQQNEKVWLTIKIFSYTEEFIDRKTRKVLLSQVGYDNSQPSDSLQMLFNQVISAPDPVVEHKVHFHILKHPLKLLSFAEWSHFERLLKESNFWQEKPFVPNEHYKDGSHWIMEAHLKYKYRFMDRHSGYLEEKYKKCGEYLIQLANLSDEKLY